MKIVIQIECDSIIDFQAHIMDMYNKTVIHLHEQSKVEDGIEDVDEFDADIINATSLLDDSNCYGNRNVFMVKDFSTV